MNQVPGEMQYARPSIWQVGSLRWWRYMLRTHPGELVYVLLMESSQR